MQKYTLTKVYVNDKNKDGQEFKDKNGKKFWKMAIQTAETGDTYHSCLFFKEDDIPNWNEGDQVTLALEENNGFHNFKVPTKYDTLFALINGLDQRIKVLEQSKPQTVGNTNVPYPDGPVDTFTEAEIRESSPFDGSHAGTSSNDEAPPF